MSKHHVMVVDGTGERREALCRLLDSVGYAAAAAASIAEFLMESTAHRPDLAIIDLQVRGWDGAETMQAIRSRLPTAPIIATVEPGFTVGRLGDGEIARRLGVSAIVRRPFMESRLIEVIDRTLFGFGTAEA